MKKIVTQALFNDFYLFFLFVFNSLRKNELAVLNISSQYDMDTCTTE